MGKGGTDIRHQREPLILGTKAETLERLKPQVQRSRVLDILYFTCRDWDASPHRLIERIQAAFSGACVVVRSSAIDEDGPLFAQAGRHHSVLDVPVHSSTLLTQAVARVRETFSGDPRDQILIQPMLHQVRLSGVMMTYELSTGAPYYVINYDDESGRTDLVTGGTCVNKTVVLHRNHRADQIESQRILELIQMARELEDLIAGGTPLDIEFARTDETLYLLQVRRVVVSPHWNRQVKAQVFGGVERLARWMRFHFQPEANLAGHSTILGQMPDWNPAEILGTAPRPLAVSLYRALITDATWADARARLGYRWVRSKPLMILLADRPYIDVRRSFNSFLPRHLPEQVAHALVDAWLERLRRHPELHDKVEFEVAQTVYDFGFEASHRARYAGVLAPSALEEYRERLRDLTRQNLTLSGSLERAIHQVQRLIPPGPMAPRALRRARRIPLGSHQTLIEARSLIERCRAYGTLPFAIIARHAFMAEALLRSAVSRGALESERLHAFKRGLGTVTTRLTRDFQAVSEGRLSQSSFLAMYGHLRPGTYDLLSVRYDQRLDLFDALQLEPVGETRPFEPTPAELAALDQLLLEAGLDPLTGLELLSYARTAIVHREEAKFIFTRLLSDAMEMLATWGEAMGLTRDDLTWIRVQELWEEACSPTPDDVEAQLKRLADERERAGQLHRSVRMGYLLRDERDLYVIPLHRAAPNFVSRKRIEAETVRLDNQGAQSGNLYQKLVCIENADPGFDWLFTRGIAGLITRFGGANSHMTIRCAELDLPAAIGVGEQTFDRLSAAKRVELNCMDRVVRPCHG